MGWCDIQLPYAPACAHAGTQRTGLLKVFRHRGIGARLMKTAVDDAFAEGFGKIQPGVRVDNLNVKSLYKRLGFDIEGVHQDRFLFDLPGRPLDGCCQLDAIPVQFRTDAQFFDGQDLVTNNNGVNKTCLYID